MTSQLAAAISSRRRDWTTATDHGSVEPVDLVYPDEGLTVSGPRSLQPAEVHTSHLGGYLTPHDYEWESCACSTRWRIFPSLSDESEQVGGEQTREPGKKREKQNGKAIESQPSKKEGKSRA